MKETNSTYTRVKHLIFISHLCEKTHSVLISENIYISQSDPLSVQFNFCCEKYNGYSMTNAMPDHLHT